MVISPEYQLRPAASAPEKPQFPGSCTAISGYRYYNPSAGRWINRDPIEEQGGANLYDFWLNDDIDAIVQTTQETEQDDQDSSHPADWTYDYIHSKRNLEDFARLQLYTGGLNDSFKNGTLYIGLKWTDVSNGAPAIKLYNNYETGGGTGYLNDPDIADSQVGVYGDGHVAIKDASQGGARTVVDGSGVFVLPERTLRWLDGGRSQDPPAF